MYDSVVPCASFTLLSVQLLLRGHGGELGLVDSPAPQYSVLTKSKLAFRHLQILAASCTGHISLQVLMYVCI